MIYNDHFFAIEDQTQRVVDQIFKSHSFKEYITKKKEMAIDSGVQAVRQEFLEKKKPLIGLPNMENMHRIIASVKEVYAKRNGRLIYIQKLRNIA
ncbi:hypothetical protein ACFQOY_12495 [Enterococcus alcedinis]|uniref:hypothetical protein n=1 Tax=Enterococcus alcedinis TaxID=1274384 RepID=UPI0036151694